MKTGDRMASQISHSIINLSEMKRDQIQSWKQLKDKNISQDFFLSNVLILVFTPVGMPSTGKPEYV